MSVHEQYAEDLALLALGSLTGEERATLEKHLEGCPSCRRELEALRGDLSLLALTTSGPRPPARAKQKLMAAIAADPRLPKPAAVPARTPSWWGALGWAAAAAMVLLGIALLRENAALHSDVASLQKQVVGQQSELQQAKETITTLVDPASQTIELVAAGSKPQPRGKAIYHRNSRSLIFLASNLPQLAPEKVYELWLFPANGGAPIPAGLFRPDAQGNATVVNPPLPDSVEAKHFAVTLEPDSGSHQAPRGTVVIAGE